MSNYMADAMAPATAIYAAEVQRDTFGHLAPEPRRAYRGWIIFARTEWGQTVPISCRFSDLPDSPWFFDDLNEFIDGADVEEGNVYRFEGTYMRFRNGRHRFSGKTCCLAAPHRESGA